MGSDKAVQENVMERGNNRRLGRLAKRKNREKEIRVSGRLR